MKHKPKQLTFEGILFDGVDLAFTKETEERFDAVVDRAKAVLAYARNASAQPRTVDKLDSLMRCHELAETLCAALIALNDELSGIVDGEAA